jgi:hypothetical protein
LKLRLIQNRLAQFFGFLDDDALFNGGLHI